MRRAMVMFTGVLAALTLALPARAKVEGTAFISGPGLPGSGSSDSGGSIRMDGSDGGGYPVLSGMLDPGMYLVSRPRGELGPRYEARLVIDFPRRQPDVVQYLYPYARGGPVIYTPPGQAFVMSATGRASDGWYAAPPELIRELQDRGLPQTTPVPLDALERPVAANSPRPGSPPVVWGLLLLGGLLVAGAMVGRRRAVARRAA